MKKSLLILAMFIGSATIAQDNMTSKKGTPILPEAGDWSIGIGASSTLNYFGNLMNGNNSAPTWDFPGMTQVIQGKMMKDANTAYRVGLRLGFKSTKEKYSSSVAGTLADTSNSEMNIYLSGGIQKFRGKGRVRGFYGGEAGLGLGSNKTTYNYNGNAPDQSTLEDKKGGTFMFNVRGFVGVEYFFAPKMSVGGEFGWGIGLSSTGEGEEKIADGIGGSTTNKDGKSSTLRLDTDNGSFFGEPSGNLILNFYF